MDNLNFGDCWAHLFHVEMVFLLSPLERDSINPVSCQQHSWAAGQHSGTERKRAIASMAPSLPESEAIKDEATEDVSYWSSLFENNNNSYLPGYLLLHNCHWCLQLNLALNQEMEIVGIAWHLKCSDNQGDARSLQRFLIFSLTRWSILKNKNKSNITIIIIKFI